ncbi:VOC family protein [Rhodococcus sp. MEB041]|uniref:VOC family protein n=1 Tax=Rhodococcus sp. MEB041 TaxID=3040323 RepID=UPI00254CF0BF|nr:VOC family protein [Rhodococcus sp. MEB041]
MTISAPDPAIDTTVTTSLAPTSMLMRVLELERSVVFYGDVFGCTVALRQEDAALLLAPDGFQIYLYADPSSTSRPIGALGVREVMWSAPDADTLEHVGSRLRRYYAATYSHTESGVSFIDGRDPDGNRVLVAFPSPLQLPRVHIARRFR